MATSAISYSATAAITIAPASLASSATFLAGVESTEIDNTTNLYLDALVQGFVTTGTTPTTAKSIRIYFWGSHTSIATTARGVLDGLSSAETIASAEERDGFLVRAKSILVNATSNIKYEFGPISVADVLGEMPQYWGVFVTHDTAVALHATAGNHEMKYTGIKYTSA